MPYFARVGSIPIDCKQTIALPCSANCLLFSLKIILKKNLSNYSNPIFDIPRCGCITLAIKFNHCSKDSLRF